MDLAPPRGDGADCPDDSAKLEISPRGFFADQFEVGFSVFLPQLFSSPLRPRPDDPVGRFFFSCARLFFESYDTIQDTLQVKESHDSFAALATLSVSSARGAFYTLWPALSLAWDTRPRSFPVIIFAVHRSLI